jgi:hypothetical protein
MAHIARIRRGAGSDKTFVVYGARVSYHGHCWPSSVVAEKAGLILKTRADLKTLYDLVRSKIRGDLVIDDKTMIMERIIQLVSNLPSDSKTRVELTNAFINELWYSLDHPPPLYIGERFQYRMADGSFNVGCT